MRYVLKTSAPARVPFDLEHELNPQQRAVVEAPFLKDTEKLDTLFLAAYSRLPRADERDRFLKVIRAKPDPAYQNQAYANIFWALLNSPEFVLCP